MRKLAFTFVLLAAVWQLAHSQRRSSFRRLNRVVTNRVGCSRSAGAAAGDTVHIHYTGTLASDGKKFDSSFDRGEPIFFILGNNRVIQGWERGLLGTCEGESLRLEIPSSLGYGSTGAGDVIPPNADLVFELTLEKLEKAGSKSNARADPTDGLTPPSPDSKPVDPRTSSRNNRINNRGRNEEPKIDIVPLEPKTCSKDEKSRHKDKVEFDYVGYLSNGNKFGSSEESGPITIEIGKTGLKGWDQGLSGMCKGEKRRVTIPPSLAYGEKGVENLIPPNETITLEITLHKVQDRTISFLERISSGSFRG